MLCYILVEPYWGLNNIDQIIHADYFMYVGLLIVS